MCIFSAVEMKYAFIVLATKLGSNETQQSKTMVTSKEDQHVHTQPALPKKVQAGKFRHSRNWSVAVTDSSVIHGTYFRESKTLKSLTSESSFVPTYT